MYRPLVGIPSPKQDIYKGSADGMRRQRIPTYFVLENKKKVVFHIPGAFPVKMGIPTWMKYFPANYKGVVIRCEETFYRLREGGGKL